MSVRSTFEESVREHAGSCTWVEGDAFERTLGELISTPAVGVPIPFEGISLDGVSITTDPSPGELDAAVTGVTPAAFAIADYGSVVIAGGPEGNEPVSLYPDTHVVVVRESDVLPNMTASFDRLSEMIADGTTSAVIATGPSATADMGALVHGAHGPKAVHVVVLADR